MITSTAFVGDVRFHQHAFESMDACCDHCGWREPWDGAAMIAHAAAAHDQEIGDGCIQCAVATLNTGLPDVCDEHYRGGVSDTNQEKQ